MKPDLFLFFTILLTLFIIENDISDFTENSNQFDIIFKDRQHCNCFLKWLRVIPSLFISLEMASRLSILDHAYWQEPCNAVERNFPISIFNSLLVAGVTVDSKMTIEVPNCGANLAFNAKFPVSEKRVTYFSQSIDKLLKKPIGFLVQGFGNLYT